MASTIRPPRAGEAEALAELHLRTWEETYAGILYVLAAHHGSGAGRALLDTVVDEGPATLWVLEENPRARAFYERNGFRADGERRPTGFENGGDEIRMLR